jgi:hypothetical protein
VAAVAGLSATPLAHGGTYGAIGEGLLAVGVAAFFVAIWLRERRHREDRAPAEFRDDEADEAD